MAGLLNALAAAFAVLPTEKEWAWAWFGGAAQKKKVEQAGGKYVTFVEAVRRLPSSSPSPLLPHVLSLLLLAPSSQTF